MLPHLAAVNDVANLPRYTISSREGDLMPYNGPQLFSEKELLSDDQAELEELGTVEGQPVTTQPVPDPDEEQQIAKIERETAALRQYTAQIQEQLARADEREKQIQEAREYAPQVAQQQANPRPEDWDPVGQKMWDKERKLEQMRAQLQQHVQHFDQFERARWNDADQRQFVATQPDYIDAANYAWNHRVQELQQFGYPPAAAQQIVTAEAAHLREAARQFGKPFAPAIYNLARRWGYTPRKNT